MTTSIVTNHEFREPDVFAVPDSPERLEVFGLDFDQLDEQGVIAHIMSSLASGRGGWMVTPNVDILRQVAGDAELADLVSGASLIVADGAPVEWAGRIARGTFAPRAPGASVFWSLSEAAADAGRPVLLLGGRQGAPEAAAAALLSQYPNIDVRTCWPPFGFERSAQALAEIHDAVDAVDGGVVFCGLGFPKQEKLMAELVATHPGVWFLGVGGSIDLAAGVVPRAPAWMQRAGIEWTYRLASEPRRLGRRYLVEDIPFAVKLMRWAVTNRDRLAS